jgi:hypothetical protein
MNKREKPLLLPCGEPRNAVMVARMQANKLAMLPRAAVHTTQLKYLTTKENRKTLLTDILFTFETRSRSLSRLEKEVKVNFALIDSLAYSAAFSQGATHPNLLFSPHLHEFSAMQSQIWASTIPLHITHPSSPTPYLVQIPRLSYLPLLLPRLTSFFGPASSFSYEGILLKNLPVGLLCDLYQPSLPWQLTLGDGPLFDIHDTFMNSVKEVCLPILPSCHLRALEIIR